MKQVTTLRQLQLIELYIYKDLLNVCKKYGLKVYLLGGTLIGAIRHQGFIPWDDDMDVCMSRSDYKKLLALTGGKISEKCRIIDPATDNQFKGCIPLAIYENSTVVSKQFKGKEDLKISISIFVYDGAPKSKVARKFYYAKMYMLRAKHALCRANFKNVTTKIARIVGPILSPFFKEENVYKYKNKVLKWQQKYDYETSEYVSTNADKSSQKEVFLKCDFEKSVEIWFEGVKSFAFSYYHEHLTKYYGDYMQLPSTEAQMPKHSFEAQIEDDFVFQAESHNVYGEVNKK